MIQPYVVYKRHRLEIKRNGKDIPFHTVISKISDITDFKSKEVSRNKEGYHMWQ